MFNNDENICNICKKNKATNIISKRENHIFFGSITKNIYVCDKCKNDMMKRNENEKESSSTENYGIKNK